MWDVFGQQKAVELLKGSLEQQKLSHAYLIVGTIIYLNVSNEYL